MYAIFISIALAIYTLIAVDFGYLHKNHVYQRELLESTQALYSAESSIELAVSEVGDQKASQSNLKFVSVPSNFASNSDSTLTYNQGIESKELKRTLSSNDIFLEQLPATFFANRAAQYSITGPLSEKSYYALAPKAYQSFALREVQPEANFNEIRFDFNSGSESSDLLLDVFQFPKSNQNMTLESFDSLKDDATLNPIKRLVINTKNQSSKSFSFEGQIPLSLNFDEGAAPYQKSLQLSGFQPLQHDYILAFQTLDNKPIHFKISAFWQGEPTILPNVFQSFDVIGVTSTGLYQRVKYQREAEEGLAPGYRFVHFSDESIIK